MTEDRKNRKLASSGREGNRESNKIPIRRHRRLPLDSPTS